MDFLKEFIDRYAFSEMEDRFFGMYNDMHVVLMKEEKGFSANLYLDLPPFGRKERRELVSRMNEKGARFDACVTDHQEKKNFLKIVFSDQTDASSSLERFLTECDLLLRPYGREMGLLCAYCRKEMQEEKPVYRMEDAMVVPVCPACANLENAGQAKKADNRRTIDKKRMRKGVLGAAFGCLVSTGLWMLAFPYAGVYIAIILSIASVFLIKWMFEKMSRIPNRLKPAHVLALALFALIVGSSVRYTMYVNESNQAMREWNAIMGVSENAGAIDPAAAEIYDGFITDGYEDAALLDTFRNPEYYKEIALPVVFVVVASLGADSLIAANRKRR